MNKPAQHTPTPWHFPKPIKGSKRPSWEVIHSESGFHVLSIWQDGGRSVLPATAKANAEFVLRACNGFEKLERDNAALVAALESAVIRLEYLGSEETGRCAVTENARAALAKAKS